MKALVCFVSLSSLLWLTGCAPQSRQSESVSPNGEAAQPLRRDNENSDPIRQIKTRIFRIETPTNEIRFYRVFATSDATIYLLSEDQRSLAENLDSFARSRTPVNLQVQDRDVLSVSPLAGAEARLYEDEFSTVFGFGPSAQLSKLEVETSPTPQPETSSANANPAPTAVPVPASVEPTAPDTGSSATIDSSDTSTLAQPVVPMSSPVPSQVPAVSQVVPSPALTQITSTHGDQANDLPRSLLAARAYGYEPTILGSPEAARQAFQSMPRLRTDSQCFQRAHVWSFELWRYSRINSMKVFMIFTKRFQETFCKYESTESIFFGRQTRCKPYKWWFHTAPFVYNRNGSQIQETVLDPEFLREPKDMESWTYHFVGLDAEGPSYRTMGSRLSREEARCIEVARFDHQRLDGRLMRPDYTDAFTRTDAWCFLRKVPMYIYSPGQATDMDLGVPQAQVREWVIDADRDHPCRLNWPLRDAYGDANPSERSNFCRP